VVATRSAAPAKAPGAIDLQREMMQPFAKDWLRHTTIPRSASH
jgi:hypothetical protein